MNITPHRIILKKTANTFILILNSSYMRNNFIRMLISRR